MSKAIYCLKIFIFRNQYLVDKQELDKFRAVCIFIVRLYAKAWFTTTNTIEAPTSDLQFIKHLWYLVPETAALSFFSTNLSTEEKR